MAQTRKKRPTKHRGNAAGIVESRGRTGRKPTDAEKASQSRADTRRQRMEDRRDQPPTWRGAANRAAIASALFVVVVIALFDQPVQTSVYVGLMAFLFYIPLGYYVDLGLYRRHQRKKAEA